MTDLWKTNIFFHCPLCLFPQNNYGCVKINSCKETKNDQSVKINFHEIFEFTSSVKIGSLEMFPKIYLHKLLYTRENEFYIIYRNSADKPRAYRLIS